MSDNTLSFHENYAVLNVRDSQGVQLGHIAVGVFRDGLVGIRIGYGDDPGLEVRVPAHDWKMLCTGVVPAVERQITRDLGKRGRDFVDWD